MKWYFKVLKQYADFNGRARRKEYWYFFLINFLITFTFGFLTSLSGSVASNSAIITFSSMFIGIYSLAIFLPSIAVGVRRLHDTNRSGWWILIGLIPFIGALILIFFFVQDSQPGTNKYGPNPKEDITINI